ncbi:hypothetical protein [Bifidobacterium tissieri]|uniref:hypothetical protein n=1 Tax=Bifidobacterium tissieri TaxID=1630162 RepID=UPI00123C21AB|nr:hypothetical protein [Bifidobacterium tissieri]KAA8832591.1 hypothetical protein EM849_03540 [Bifidobacterium tissieri]
MKTVSETYNWIHATADSLAGRRYLARTWNGTTIDGHLDPLQVGPMTVMADRDILNTVIIIGRNGQANTLAIGIRCITVLDERD